MIRAGFLDPETRSDLIDLGRDGSWLTGWPGAPTRWYYWMMA